MQNRVRQLPLLTLRALHQFAPEYLRNAGDMNMNSEWNRADWAERTELFLCRTLRLFGFTKFFPKVTFSVSENERRVSNITSQIVVHTAQNFTGHFLVVLRVFGGQNNEV